MRLSTLCTVALLAVSSIGLANAGIISNGNFSGTSGTIPSGYDGHQAGYAGFTLNSWDASGYTIWYANPYNAVNGCAYTEYHNSPGSENGSCSTLNAVGATLPGGAAVTSFIAMDGLQSGSLQGSVKQQLGGSTGLTVGAQYTLTFYWGGTQETQASTPANSYDQYLKVSLGGSPSQNTSVISTPLGSFTGWNLATMTFTANEANPWLTFLAFGQPENGPPMITLTNVSMARNVPEPPELAMFGIGMLGLGLLTVLARRRALRRLADSDASGLG